jgi:benzoyl-CoA reductase/2-hydroxyglutaryl-CoA dehydratase subunit BcrC/BadD/HgdB
MSQIGITTTIPVEVVYAAGEVPVDINNVFITDPDPAVLVEEAERAGFPHNVCGWTKGIYAAVKRANIGRLIVVTQGDCSNTHALTEVLTDEGVEIIPFAYPYDRDRDLLALSIDKLREHLGASPQEVAATKRRLDDIRAKVHRIDSFSWRTGAVGGGQAHYFQVCCSDFNRDPEAFDREVEGFLMSIESCEPPEASPPEGLLRLGYIGVPPILTDLFDFIETLGARVVFDEVARQFAMPFDTDDLVEQYRLYTYPYDVFGRIADIQAEIARRRLDGIIHYTQSFCFHQIEDMIIRRHLDLPILTLEGDRPGHLDARTKLRIESFVEMLG